MTLPEKLYKDLKKYFRHYGSRAQLCVHCRLPKKNHVDGKCMFDVSSWAPVFVRDTQLELLQREFPTLVNEIKQYDKIAMGRGRCIAWLARLGFEGAHRRDLAEIFVNHLCTFKTL